MHSQIPGGLSISNEVIADMAGYAALECYGVVGMATPSYRPGWLSSEGSGHLLFTEFVGAVLATVLPFRRLRRGIVIDAREGGVHLDLFVVVEYGVNITAVAENMRDTVKYTLEEMAGVKVDSIEVHVDGVKVRR